MGNVGTSGLLGGDAGDVSYPYYLVNGRIPAAPTTFAAKPGQRIRIRLINAGSDTAFRVALGRPHDDRHPHRRLPGRNRPRSTRCCWGWANATTSSSPPATGSSRSSPRPREERARAALLSTGAGKRPDPAFQPTELNGRVGTVDMLHRHTGRRPGSAEARHRPAGGALRRHDALRLGDQRAAATPTPAATIGRANGRRSPSPTPRRCGTRCTCTATPSR